MNCKEVQERIELFVLGEVGGEERAEIAAHLTGCAACRSAEEEYRALVGKMVAGAGTDEDASGVERRVRSAVRAELVAERGRRRRRWLAASAAAVVMIAAGVSLWQVWQGARPEAGLVVRRGEAEASAWRPASALERWRYAGVETMRISVADEAVVHGDMVYLLRRERLGARVTAVDARTGRARWESQTPSVGYLAADDAGAYCLASREPGRVELVALNAEDGSERWRRGEEAANPRRSACAPVPLPDGRVCWTAGPVVDMLDGRSGALRWSRRLAEAGQFSGAAWGGGVLYVAGAGVLYCLDAESGEPAWREPLEPGAGQRPVLAVAGSRIYVAEGGGGDRCTLTCIDAERHRRMWTRPVGDRIYHVLAADARVFLRGQQVWAVNGETGDTVWTRSVAGCSPITRERGLLCLLDAADGGRLVALDEQTGKEAWVIAGLRSCERLAMAGDTGLVKTHDGVVHAILLSYGGH